MLSSGAVGFMAFVFCSAGAGAAGRRDTGEHRQHRVPGGERVRGEPDQGGRAGRAGRPGVRR